MEFETGFSVKQGPFPYKTGKFGLERAYGRSDNAIPILITGTHTSFCPNVWIT